MGRSVTELLSSLLGLVLLLVGGISLVAAPPVGAVIVLVGLYVFPPSRRRLRIDISAGRLVVWCVGIVLLLFGLTVALQSPGAGALAIGAGLLALPPVRRQLERQGGIQMRSWMVGLLVLSAGAASFGLVSTQIDTTPERDNITHSMNESFTVNTSRHGTLRVNVTDAQDLYRPVPAGRETPVTPTDEAFLAVYVTFENVGNKTAIIDDSSTVTLTNGDHTEFYDPSHQAPKVEFSNRLDDRLLDLYNNDFRLDPGEEVDGVIVYSVDTDKEYHLRVSPGQSDVEGDHHYVPIRVIFARFETG